MDENTEDTTAQTSTSFVPIGAVLFVTLMLILIVAAWVGMYLLLLHRAVQ
jgi:hypothetical protein